MPALSIITINLDNADGLEITIRSIITQNSSDFEYLVIDGGSTDGSVEVIKKYSDKITYWVSEPDKGIYNAMNKGILKATGEYCQFLNSGDWLAAPDVIEKMLATLPECSIYYGNMLKMNTKRKIYRDTCEQGNISMLTFYKGTLNHSPALIKRSLFDKYDLYDETLKIVSDWKWFLNVIGLNNETVQYINLDVTYFDMNGISNSNPDLDKQERRKVLTELLPSNILADYDDHWLDIEQMKKINNNKLTHWMVLLIERIHRTDFSLAYQIHNQVINHFNDFYFDENNTVAISKIINQHI